MPCRYCGEQLPPSGTYSRSTKGHTADQLAALSKPISVLHEDSDRCCPRHHTQISKLRAQSAVVSPPPAPRHHLPTCGDNQQLAQKPRAEASQSLPEPLPTPHRHLDSPPPPWHSQSQAGAGLQRSISLPPRASGRSRLKRSGVGSSVSSVRTVSPPKPSKKRYPPRHMYPPYPLHPHPHLNSLNK